MEPVLHAGASLWHAGACVDTLNPSFCKSYMYVFDFLMPQVILRVCFQFLMTQAILHVCFAFERTQVIIVSNNLRNHTPRFLILLMAHWQFITTKKKDY